MGESPPPFGCLLWLWYCLLPCFAAVQVCCAALLAATYRSLKVALVGRSGSGKSSVANLILGMYDPTDGLVLVDGRHVHEYCPDWFYRRCISAVSATPTLLNGTLEENLTLGLEHKEVPCATTHYPMGAQKVVCPPRGGGGDLCCLTN